MRVKAILVSLLIVGCASSRDASPVAGSRQLILVVSPAWESTLATMRRFERVGDSWREVGSAAEVILGRTGLAWGRGLTSPKGDGPVKREGDCKSPAGVFRLGNAFGFSPAPQWMRLPYLELHETTECVDDFASALYNQVVDRNSVPRSDWSSSEKMREISVYQWGVVVLHNVPARNHDGSCIFLHLVDPNGKPTAGCTSMPAAAMDALLRWISPDAHPLLVQLPRSEYDRLRRGWGLP